MNVTEREKLEAIPSKIDNNEILQLVKSPFTENRIYFNLLKTITHSDDKVISDWLNISEKTYRSYKSTDKATKPSLVELAIMLIALFKHGVEIFGTAEQFTKWLEKENFYFDRKAPIKFIDTVSGIKFIDDRLTGIEYGDNA